VIELLWVVVFIGGLFVIEWWYISHHDLTISEHAQQLNAAMPKQVLAGIMFGRAIAGWFVAHFTS
jgi:hypothetical protein